MALGVTSCTEEVMKVYRSTQLKKAFLHGHSFTANPIACAVAAANLEMWQEGKVKEQIRATAARQKRKLTEMAALESLTNLRQTGTIAAMDIQVSDSGYLSEIGTQLYLRFQKSGVLLRPLGNTIYVLPPYCMSENDFNTVYGVIAEAISDLVHA